MSEAWTWMWSVDMDMDITLNYIFVKWTWLHVSLKHCTFILNSGQIAFNSPPSPPGPIKVDKGGWWKWMKGVGSGWRYPLCYMHLYDAVLVSTFTFTSGSLFTRVFSHQITFTFISRFLLTFPPVPTKPSQFPVSSSSLSWAHDMLVGYFEAQCM